MQHTENRNVSLAQSLTASADQKDSSLHVTEANRGDPNKQINIAPKRLNPFALPAETDSRFNLFAIAAIMWVLNSAVMLWGWLPEAIYGGSTSGQTDNVSGLLWFQVGMPVAAIFLAAALYGTHPQRIVRRQQLQPFDPLKDAAFAQAIEESSGIAELTKLPTIMLSQSKRMGGQVFGLRRRYILRLDDRLRLALRRAPATFRAIVLHELAHIANQDIGRTYFSQALWTATIWLTAVPLLVFLSYDLIGSRLPLLLTGSFADADVQKFFRVSLPSFLFLLFQFGIGLLLVAAIRASLLRVREIYADWRVATWGSEQPLHAILKRNAPVPPIQVNVQGQLRRLLRLHPTSTERINFLQESHRLFTMAYDIPLFVGWLTSTIIWGAAWLYTQTMNTLSQGGVAFILLVEPYIQNPSSDLVANFMLVAAFLSTILMFTLVIAPFLLMAYLVIQSIGIQVLHEVLRDLFFHQRSFRPYVRLLLASILLVVGLYLGIATSVYAYNLLTFDYIVHAVPRDIVLFSLLIWLCMASLRYFGGWILGFHTGKQLPVWKCRILFLLFSVVVGALFALFFVWNLVNTARYSSFAATIQDVDTNLIAEAEFVLWVMLLCAALAIFLTTWAWIKIWHWLRPARCPQCQMLTEQSCAIGQVCSYCGAELTPWLFVVKPLVI